MNISWKKLTYLLVGLSLFVIVPVAFAVPVSFDWGSFSDEGGVKDLDNATPLQDGDRVEFIWAGPDSTIAPPACDGTPGGDDVLLDVASVVAVGSFPPPFQNTGSFPLKTYNFDDTDPEAGGTVFVRAWNAADPQTATAYGESTATTLTSNGQFNFPPWNTDTVWPSASYTGANGGDWNTAGNWSSNSVPDSSTAAVIPAGKSTVLSASAAVHCLLVEDGAVVNLGEFDMTAIEPVINHGELIQTRDVDNSVVEFLQISTDRYRGVRLDSTGTGANLGSVTVSIRAADTGAGEFCTSAGASSPAYAERCFTINTQFNGPAHVRLYSLDGELNGLTTSNLSVYRNVSASVWQELTLNRATGTASGGYSFAEGDTTGFSAFLLADELSAPTAIHLESFTARSPASSFVGLAVSGLVLFTASIWVIWKRGLRI